jgi:hypothetical protein
VFPLDAAQVVTTLEPGESRTFEFMYEDLVREIGTGLISATIVFECGGAEEVTFRLSAAPPEGESLGENGKIAFSSQTDGSEHTRLTNNPAIDDTPDWGPATDIEPEDI